tara:strand:+ start:733 stop:1755 length:1023 start_codon:yes stop_codon:yes gene_type:complete
MDQKRIIFLLDQKKNNLASETELLELTELIRSGRFDELIKNEMYADFSDALANAKSFDKESFNADSVFENIIVSDQEDFEQSTNFFLPKRYLSWAAAILVFVLGIGWLSYKKVTRPAFVISENAEIDTQIQSNSEKRFVTLPDGSTVILNTGSELTYSSSFSQKRSVKLTGEAFFDIQKDPEHPFTVQTGDVITTVLGTAFNIKVKEESIKVTVERGLVEVGNSNHVFAQIKPLEAIKVDTKTLKYQLEKGKHTAEADWRKPLLLIDELSMQEVMDLLEKRYGKKIIINNPAIKKCRVSANFLNDEPLEDILMVICGSRQATYQTVSKNTIAINGGLSCN